MPRSEKQKLKLYYVIEIFKTMTDENHPITVTEIIELLEKKGIKAERKSIYRDIEAMEVLGFDIIQVHGKHFCYYLAEREFETAELRLLVDAVQASRFITKKKSKALIKKLEALTTIFDAQRLQSQVFVTNRIKASNESIYYNVDTIHNAINENSRIAFRYYDWDIHKRKVFRHNNKLYNVSPWSLIWDHENYYLIAYDTEDECIKHYRVDRMMSIDLTNQPREGKALFSEVDIAEYAQQFFGMYNGEILPVTLQCDQSVTNAVIDRFGTDVVFEPQADGEHFNLTIRVAVSPVFLSWVFMFGGQIKIISPDSLNDQLKEMAKKYMES